MLEITEIGSTNEFFGLQDVWTKALVSSKDNNIFLTWEYMVNCVTQLGESERLRILCVMDESKIVAIVPLRQTCYSFGKWLAYDVLEPLAYRVADYTGLILTDEKPEYLRLLIDHLYKNKYWDFVYLYNIQPTYGKLFASLAQDKTGFPKFSTFEGSVCPYITLPDSIDELMNGLRPKFRKNLRRSMKNLQRDHGKMELKNYTDIGSLEETMQIFFDLHQKRWIKRGHAGAFARQKQREMSLNCARLFAEKGWLNLFFLVVKSKPVAAQCCFEYNRKMYYWLGGFDPAFSSYSVGNLLIMQVLESCVERKIQEYDFMRGDEAYKFDWGAEFRRLLNIKFVNNRFHSKLYNLGISAAKKTKLAEAFDKSHYW